MRRGVTFRKALAAEFAARIAAAAAGGHLPEQDAALAGAALVGLLIEALIGPLAPDATGRERDVVQSLTLIALRALGVADARARGLVVQTAIPGEALFLAETVGVPRGEASCRDRSRCRRRHHR